MIRVASYNIRKAIGLDRRRDPERTLTVLRELQADVVALQEADRRFGSRASAIPPLRLREFSDYRAVQLDTRPDSIGWHGNAILVREGTEVLAAGPIPLPTLEPRGAVFADVALAGRTPIRVVGMHLDLSGIRRRQQIRAILHHSGDCGLPMVLMAISTNGRLSAARCANLARASACWLLAAAFIAAAWLPNWIVWW